MRRRVVLVPALVAAVTAFAVALIQLRNGIVPLLDTVTYWSGTRSSSTGHFFTTELAPSFSNFTAVEFAERGGRLPFVDFPVGYPTLAGLLALLTGASGAMILLVVSASVVTAALITIGPAPTDMPGTALRGITAIGVALLPASRLVVQGALSEPLFIALAIAYLVTLVRYRDGNGSWTPVVLVGVALGLVRFIGAPLAVLAGIEHFRRHRRIVPALGWTATMGAPAAVNVFAAASAGGGHSPGWRGLDDSTLELFARSVGGWFDARQGDLRITYFGGEGAATWSWALTVVWTVGAVTGIAAVLASVARTPRGWANTLARLPASFTLPMAAAGIITGGLVAGMLGFDALVVPDNRLMLPTGVLTLVAIVWTFTSEQHRTRPSSPSFVVAVIVVACWFVAAVRPWNVLERFSDDPPTPPYVTALIERDPDLVITNSADGVHWDTRIPAAYLPLPVRALTGEIVDQEAELRALPCPLHRANGVILVVDGALFGSSGDDTLQELVELGHLERRSVPGGVLYEPLAVSCT
jgi:hypothetical protein